jgi:hypothetical protein
MKSSVCPFFEDFCCSHQIVSSFFHASLNAFIKLFKTFNDKDLNILFVILSQIFRKVTFINVPLKLLRFLFEMVGLDHYPSVLFSLRTFLYNPGSYSFRVFLPNFI